MSSHIGECLQHITASPSVMSFCLRALASQALADRFGMSIITPLLACTPLQPLSAARQDTCTEAAIESAQSSCAPGLSFCVLFRTWSSTLLQSSNEVFTYGISGAFWYAAGAVLQVLPITARPSLPKFLQPDAGACLHVPIVLS